MSNYSTHDGKAAKNDGINQAIEVYTDKLKLLGSNDKKTIQDLWKGKPDPFFPDFFLRRLDLHFLIDQASSKA